MFRKHPVRYSHAACAIAAAAAIAVAPLGGCGVKGPLKLPPATPAAKPAVPATDAPPESTGAPNTATEPKP